MSKIIKIILTLFIAFATTNFSFAQKKTTVDKTQQPEPIVVEMIGEGNPIFYLPGFTVAGSIWKETTEKTNLNGKSYYISYAGFNGNKPIEMPWYSSIKKAIIKYIKENNLNKITVVGHSMGGNLAVDLAYELPNKISKIIIVDALPCMREVMMPNVPAESLFYESPYNKQMLEMNETQFKGMAAMMASNMTLNKEKFETLTNWILEADRKTWVYGYTDLLKLDLRSTLNKIKCKTLIIGASFPDVNIAKKHYENQYTTLKNKTIVMASNSKHFVMFDQPEWFYKTINDFLIDEKK